MYKNLNIDQISPQLNSNRKLKPGYYLSDMKRKRCYFCSHKLELCSSLSSPVIDNPYLDTYESFICIKCPKTEWPYSNSLFSFSYSLHLREEKIAAQFLYFHNINVWMDDLQERKIQSINDNNNKTILNLSKYPIDIYQFSPMVLEKKIKTFLLML